MRTGNLDRRITLQRPAVVDDPLYGPQAGGWENIYSRIPAQVQDDLPSRSESVQDGLRLSNRPARVRMRYLRGITSDMRVIVHNEVDDIYQLSSEPAEIGRREWIEFTVTEYTS